MQIYSGRRSNLALSLAIEGSLAMHTFPWDPVTLTQHLGLPQKRMIQIPKRIFFLLKFFLLKTA